MFVHYFVRLWTSHYTLFTMFIFDSARNLMRNLLYRPLWHYVKIPIAWREWRNAKWEKWLLRRFTKCHLHTFRFSRFTNIFLRSRQFDDKCIAGLITAPAFTIPNCCFCSYSTIQPTYYHPNWPIRGAISMYGAVFNYRMLICVLAVHILLW